MWLAVILHCITLEADTCDIMVRTGGLFQDKPACSDSVTKMGKALSKNKVYVATHCFKLRSLGETV